MEGMKGCILSLVMRYQKTCGFLNTYSFPGFLLHCYSISQKHEISLDHPDWINGCNLYDQFIPTPGNQDIEIQKDRRCFFPDVCNSYHGIVSLADLWNHTGGFAINHIKQYQFCPLSMCAPSQNKARVTMTSQHHSG